jgi:hypothetical protein
MVNQADMNELKRIYTNTYNADKACMNRIIQGITSLNNQVRVLKAENAKLLVDLQEANQNK